MRSAIHALTALVLVVALGACSKTPAPDTKAAAPAADAAPTAAPSSPAASVYDRTAAAAQGITIGNMMATRVVYVLFDTQCPHCGMLWEQSKPLLGQLKMVWAPVRMIGELSAKQGAAILSAKDPVAEMDAHERSLEAKRGGLVPPDKLPADALEKVAANTKLMKELGVGSVPFVVYKHPTTGQALSFEGALSTADLRKTFGL